MATHSSTLAWRIPGMREPGGLRVAQSWTGLKRLSSSSSSSSNGKEGTPVGSKYDLVLEGFHAI